MKRKTVKRPYQQQPEIKAAMRLLGMTTKAVAARVDLSPGYVTLLLNGFAKSDQALTKIGRLVKASPRL